MQRPDFSYIVRFDDIKHEISYLETGRPDSTTFKQRNDHNKLARISKDSIQRAKQLNYLKEKVFRNEISKGFLTIFTINIIGT